MSLKEFEPNTKMFVMCADCLFFVEQKNFFDNSQGLCKNEYLYRMAPYYKRYLKIFDSEHESCGCSFPKKGRAISPKEYFNRNNFDSDTSIRRDLLGKASNRK